MASIGTGDIHGNAIGVRDVLRQLRPEVREGDTVVFLGDYIDRGPDSKSVVDEILSFTADVSATVVCLEGNHGNWMLRSWDDHTRHSWLLGMDGLQTIRSYSSAAADALIAAVAAAGGALYTDRVTLPYDLFFHAMPQSHANFFRSLKPYYQNEDAIFVHAGFDDRLPLAEQTPSALLFGWDGGRFPEAYAGERTVLYGHRNNPDVDTNGWPWPRRIGRTIGLDTSHHGIVTALRLPDERLFQSTNRSMNTNRVPRTPEG
jgi:serine/threonine protein phosphatase 1